MSRARLSSATTFCQRLSRFSKRSPMLIVQSAKGMKRTRSKPNDDKTISSPEPVSPFPRTASSSAARRPRTYKRVKVFRAESDEDDDGEKIPSSSARDMTITKKKLPDGSSAALATLRPHNSNTAHISNVENSSRPKQNTSHLGRQLSSKIPAATLTSSSTADQRMLSVSPPRTLIHSPLLSLSRPLSNMHNITTTATSYLSQNQNRPAPTRPTQTQTHLASPFPSPSKTRSPSSKSKVSFSRRASAPKRSSTSTTTIQKLNMHRRPSGPGPTTLRLHQLSNKWTVPTLSNPRLNNLRRYDSGEGELPPASLDSPASARSGSFFSNLPQACSTPLGRGPGPLAPTLSPALSINLSFPSLLDLHLPKTPHQSPNAASTAYSTPIARSRSRPAPLGPLKLLVESTDSILSPSPPSTPSTPLVSTAQHNQLSPLTAATNVDFDIFTHATSFSPLSTPRRLIDYPIGPSCSPPLLPSVSLDTGMNSPDQLNAMFSMCGIDEEFGWGGSSPTPGARQSRRLRGKGKVQKEKKNVTFNDYDGSSTPPRVKRKKFMKSILTFDDDEPLMPLDWR
jgi:hypothetical protein